MTNDYNLNKVAQLHGVDVININDLANALKPVVLPGEHDDVKIIKPGEEPARASAISKTARWSSSKAAATTSAKPPIIVTSVLQTSRAGKMVFGRAADGGSGERRAAGRARQAPRPDLAHEVWRAPPAEC